MNSHVPMKQEIGEIVIFETYAPVFGNAPIPRYTRMLVWSGNTLQNLLHEHYKWWQFHKHPVNEHFRLSVIWQREDVKLKKWLLRNMTS